MVKKYNIQTDVVDCKIPLLLRKDAMKKAEMIGFAADTVTIFGLLWQNILVICMKLFQ